MKLRSLLLVLAAALPIAVSAASLKRTPEPARMDSDAAARIALDVLAKDAPSTCKGDMRPSAEGPTAETATGCCWIFFRGIWWCVVC